MRPLAPLLALALSATAAAEPGPAAAVLAELSAADRARATLADEQSRWRLEADRQAILAETLEAEARRLEQRAAALRTQAVELADDEALAALDGQINAREARAARITTAITAGLAPLAHRWAPPIPASGLAGALALLAAAEQAADEIEVAIQTAHDPQSGNDIAVQTLRLGLMAMWWRSLDGRTAGVIALDDGTRRMQPLTPTEQLGVAAAFAVASGQKAPHLVELPVRAP